MRIPLVAIRAPLLSRSAGKNGAAVAGDLPPRTSNCNGEALPAKVTADPTELELPGPKIENGRWSCQAPLQIPDPKVLNGEGSPGLAMGMASQLANKILR